VRTELVSRQPRALAPLPQPREVDVVEARLIGRLIEDAHLERERVLFNGHGKRKLILLRGKVGYLVPQPVRERMRAHVAQREIAAVCYDPIRSLWHRPERSERRAVRE